MTIISLFASKTGITHAIASYQKKETTEYYIVTALLGEFLSSETPILQQADALHSKKTMETIVAADATYAMPIKGDNLRGVAAAKAIAGQRAPEEIYYTEQTAHSRSNSWMVCVYTLENTPGFELFKDCQ